MHPKKPNNIKLEDVIAILTLQGSTNLIFACTDFRACQMVLRTYLCTQNYVSIKQWWWELVKDMLNMKGLVTLIEYQEVGWRLIKVENCDNENYERYT